MLLWPQAEFLRLSLGLKCDWFTLEKRVKLEERSRDLAEENLKKEITNCLKLLEVSNDWGWAVTCLPVRLPFLSLPFFPFLFLRLTLAV